MKMKYRSNKKTLEGPLQRFPIHKHYTTTILCQLQKKLQYAGIVVKIKIYDNTNRDFRVIGLLI